MYVVYAPPYSTLAPTAMAWINASFEITKQSDAEIVAAVRTALDESGIAWTALTIQTGFGPQVSASAEDVDSNATIQGLLKKRSTLAQTLSFSLQLPGFPAFPVVIQRQAGQTADVAMVNLQQAGHIPESAELISQIGDLVQALKKHLHALDTQKALTGLLAPAIRKHYEARENELQRLEGIVSGSLAKITEEATELRTILDAEHRERIGALEARFEERHQQLEADHERREAELAEREATLRARAAEMDERDARAVRRALRQGLKEEIAKQSERFELTPGTQGLRQPIFVFAVVLLVLFGAGMLGYAGATLWLLFDGKTLSMPMLVSMALKQVAFTAAFASTAVFFIRWNNRWFEQHASEEFRLKRFSLDLDRASWVVEMAMEWQNEKGSELPAELVDRLTENLFGTDARTDAPLHPADQLASALLGASAEAQVELPTGGFIRFDRKGIRGLQRAQSEDGAKA